MAVESIRGNLSTTGRLRANLAVGGGSEVSITPTYDSGIKIADYSIDGTQGEIYIPNSGYSQTLIYENETPLTGSHTVTLLESIFNYDAICILFYIPNEGTYISSQIAPIYPVIAINNKFTIYSFPTYGNRYINIEVETSTPTKAIINTGSWQDVYYPSVYKIIGIKY